MNISLILGCFGLEENKFISCLGIENEIFILNSNHPKYKEISNFFDSYQLFDKPLLDGHGIKHFISSFRESFDDISNRVWTENQHVLMFKFVNAHKLCGLYLKLTQHFEKQNVADTAIIISPLQEVYSNSNLKAVHKLSLLKKMKGIS